MRIGRRPTAARASAKLQLDLREDLDGKPDSASLLSGTVSLELLGPVGLPPASKEVGQANWVSVALPSEFKFQAGKKYWLVLQSLENEAAWSIGPAMARTAGIQRTQDGGLSWRAAVVRALSGPLGAFFRLRRRPEQFEVPIQLQVGDGAKAVRVKLDRFDPLGRVDFNLDFDEVTEAFNQHLAKAAPAACPETEHLINGNFEHWFRIGYDLMEPQVIDLGSGVSPKTVAVSPDGSSAYVASVKQVPGSDDTGFLQLIDVVCNKTTADLRLDDPPTALALSPDGAQAYLALPERLRVIETLPAFSQREVNLQIGHIPTIEMMVLSPDGGQVFAATNAGVVVLDTAGLAFTVESPTPLSPLTIFPKPATALALAPDGRLLYVTTDAGLSLFDTGTFQQVGNMIPVGKGPTGIALTPDGKQALVTNAENSVNVINTASGDKVASIKLGEAPYVGQSPLAVVISSEGTQAYVANSSSTDPAFAGTVAVIDLVRRTVVREISMTQSPTALAITPSGDRIYVIGRDKARVISLNSIQVGTRQLAEWNLSSGWVAPVCLPAPFHFAAVLGAPEGKPSLPSALSQVVPVAESCAYEFSFWGISTDNIAVAEVFWLAGDCGLVRKDEMPIELLGRVEKVASLPDFQRTLAATTGSALVLHRLRLMAPSGAQQAEIRFNVSAGVFAAIDLVSLIATTDAVANSDFMLQEAGQLANWTLLPGAAPGVAVLATDGRIQLRNAGAQTAELVQNVPVQGDQPFVLEVQGRASTRSAVQANPRLEMRWLKADGTLAGSPTTLELLPTGFDSSIANGTSPTQASQAEIRLVVPAGTSQEMKRVSLRFEPRTLVPVTFVAQAPGELTISDWRVAFEIQKPQAPPVPERGLCTATPPDRQPGETPFDCCHCSSCEKEQKMADPTSMITSAGRPVLVGRCSTCGVEMMNFGGQQVLGASPFSLRPIPGFRPVVLEPVMMRLAETSPKTARPTAGPATLRDISFIEPEQLKKLAAAGIDSPRKLARTPVDKVAALLAVSRKVAANLTREARRLTSKAKPRRRLKRPK